MPEDVTRPLSFTGELAVDLPGRYAFQRLLGSGGMGIVVEALDSELQQPVAIKLLHDDLTADSGQIQRFMREAKALAMMNHPNILKIKTFGVTENGRPYQVVELLTGQTLADRLKSGPLTPLEFREIFTDVARGLEYASAAGIVHRDIKPSNIFLGEKESDFKAKVVDFGIARVETAGQDTTRSLTGTSVSLGSPLYMSPEQCRCGNLDYLSDIYSLGCVMFECLTGSPPFVGESPLETMFMHANDACPTISVNNPQSAALADMVMACLEKDPAKRPQSYASIIEALNQSISMETISLGIINPLQASKAARSIPVFKLTVAVGLVIAGAIGSIATVNYLNNKNTPRTETLAARKRRLETENLLKAYTLHKEQIEKLNSPEQIKEKYGDLVSDCQILGNYYKNSNPPDREQARKFFNEALVMVEKSNTPLNLKISVYDELASLERDGNNLEKAKSYLDRAIGIYRDHPDPVLLRGTTNAAIHRAEVFMKMDRMKDALGDIREFLKYSGREHSDQSQFKKIGNIGYVELRTIGPNEVLTELRMKTSYKDVESRLDAAEIYLLVADSLISYRDPKGTAHVALECAAVQLDTCGESVRNKRVRQLYISLLESEIDLLELKGKTTGIKEREAKLARLKNLK